MREVSPAAVDELLRGTRRAAARRAALGAGGGARVPGRRAARALCCARTVDGALLQELYTRDGIGTLVAVEAFEGMRMASARDLPGIVELIRPLEARGVLVPRSRERLEREIDHFVVLERDGLVVACAALYAVRRWHRRRGVVLCGAPRVPQGRAGRAACSASSSDARLEPGMTRVCSCSPRTRVTGFRSAATSPPPPDALPADRRSLYNPAAWLQGAVQAAGVHRSRRDAGAPDSAAHRRQ